MASRRVVRPMLSTRGTRIPGGRSRIDREGPTVKLILTLESGAEHGRLLLLRLGQSLTIGRSEMADVPIPTDDQLSRVHFSVACANDGCHLRDLESRNGTLVNDR